jgi:hypothetical protein
VNAAERKPNMILVLSSEANKKWNRDTANAVRNLCPGDIFNACAELVRPTESGRNAKAHQAPGASRRPVS